MKTVVVNFYLLCYNIVQYTCANASLTNLYESELGFASLCKFCTHLLLMLLSHLYELII
jgi:hypothetical protein